MLKDLKITEFLKKTASGDPVPGGGSAAALTAALAASLSEMVANLTIGKKGFEAVEDQMKDIADKATALREKLLEDIDNDSEAYQKVMAAFQFPKDTETEKKQRMQAIQDALRKAALVPLSVARDALKIMALTENVIKKGNPNAATDGAVGAMMARTAALAALYNVRINLSAIKDKTFVTELTREACSIEGQIKEKEAATLAHVKISSDDTFR